MGKRFMKIDGSDFTRMVLNGAEFLRTRADRVNALNVFPVPDGDTGTNMSLTMDAGAAELRRRPSSHIGNAAEALSKGLLLGARGNSGVILSQLFRGFAQFVREREEISVAQFAAALQAGVETAYKAVLKPVEGTILTVAREAAGQAVLHARKYGDTVALLHDVWQRADEALAKTPEQLPVLKQAGVVDAGGQGLVFLYEGFLAAFTEPHSFAEENVGLPKVGDLSSEEAKTAPKAAQAVAETAQMAQAKLATEEIIYPYDMEFFIRLADGSGRTAAFAESAFRAELERLGDSVIVIADRETVKVHIHAAMPGNVLNAAIRYGELSDIRMLNMRDQHRELLEAQRAVDLDGSDTGARDTGGLGNGKLRNDGMEESGPDEGGPDEGGAAKDGVRLGDYEKNGEVGDDGEKDVGGGDAEKEASGTAAAGWFPIGTKRYGSIAVASGEGLSRIFRSLGVDRVLTGGQTMNPSTEEIVEAIKETDAQTVYVLPNNSNIILAAQQAQQLVSDQTVEVIPVKTIPQGLAAALAFDASASSEQNRRAMTKAAETVRSGQVTLAVRNSQMDGLDIREGDYLGILDNRIIASDPDPLQTCTSLLAAMIGDHTDIVTIYTGVDADDPTTGRLLRVLKEKHPQVEVELHEGGQPIYVYLFSAE